MGNNIDHDIVELRGSSISYFTGKMENYLQMRFEKGYSRDVSIGKHGFPRW